MMKSIEEVSRLIRELDSLNTGKQAATSLVGYGPLSVEPLRKFLLEGKPRKIFQPRFWAVEALARLGAKEVLMEYLFRDKHIADPEDRFGEEAVESAAARFLASWPDEDVHRALLKLSERRMLVGLIEALAGFKCPEAIPFFERALEDDFYRPAAEDALQKLGVMSCNTLVQSAVTPVPSPSTETSSSLERRRSAVRLLNKVGMPAKHWQILRRLIYEPDKELVVGASKLGMGVASNDDRVIIIHRLVELVSSVPWYLQEDVADMLVALEKESAEEIENEIARRTGQPENIAAVDGRLHALLRVKRRFKKV